MKSAVLVEAGKIEVRESDIPDYRPDEVRVKVRYCGICTLEQRLFAGDMKIYYPIVLGHEVSGVVDAVGSEVRSSVSVGEHVALDMVYRCHQCYYCRTGQSNLCENRYAKGVKPLGGFSEYVVVRPQRIFPVSPELPLEEAALTEPLACCLRSLKKLNVALTEDVLIIGAGPMGLLHLQAALAMGARVFVSDIDASRLKTAASLGADFIINPLSRDLPDFVHSQTGGRGIDACVVTSPAVPALESACRAIRRNGRINIYTAYMHEPPKLPINMDYLHRNEVLVTGTEGRTDSDFHQAARLLSFGRVKAKPLISRIVGFDDLEEGIRAACGPATQRVLLGMSE